jgi:hypothetical protein
MKQTSIEWLVNELKKSKHYQQMINEVHQNSTVAIDVIDQALAMEKEQIIDSFVECWKENMPEGYECKQSAEYYYQETYGGNNHIADTNKMVCEHSYSRSMNQPYPRKCIKCKELEGGNNE